MDRTIGRAGRIGLAWTLALVALGCGNFRLVTSRYKETKTVAIVQAIGKPDKDLKVPYGFDDLRQGMQDLGNALSDPLNASHRASPWERVITNDVGALQDLLQRKGLTVIPIDEMVRADAYRKKGESVPSGLFAPQGMKRFMPTSNIRHANLDFLTSTALAEQLGVDAIVCIYERWHDDSASLGTQKVAKTGITFRMADRHSNQIWGDDDYSDSTKPISEAMGIKQASVDDFIGAYNEAFLATLKKMEDRLDKEIGHI